jgi:heat shock protein HslJ
MILSLRGFAPVLTTCALALAPLFSVSRAMAEPVLRGEWRVASIDGRPPAAQASLNFDDKGRVSGRAVCNRFAASYEASGEALAISRAASTRMACPPPLMEQEALFLAILNDAARFSFAGEALVLQARDGRTIVARRPA